ncbi:MAG: acetylornithine deacetylase [Planctomycetota bacterium]|nr:MAG: acetylornithine deacetylase [Planctomycetota bacterium]
MPVDALTLAERLIRFPSVSSQSNADIADFAAELLRGLGCRIERTEYENPPGTVKVNVVGKLGEGTGGLAYFGHLDVVPAESWTGPGGDPFGPVVENGRLYGRGACDMKGSVAAFLAAVAGFDAPLKAPVYIALTADEEVNMRGAEHLAAHSAMFREMVAQETAAIIGEPTRLRVVYAHKGGAGFEVVAHGRAAHSSTDHGINANWAMVPFLVELKRLYERTRTDPKWLNDEFDPPHISLNVTLCDHNPAINITPEKSVCRAMFRPMPGQNPNELLDEVRALAERMGLSFEPLPSASPVYIDPADPFVREALAITQTDRPLTVSYGTDGARLTALKRMLVLGPGDIAQAHTADEWIELEQLEAGVRVYREFIRRFCT